MAKDVCFHSWSDFTVKELPLQHATGHQFSYRFTFYFYLILTDQLYQNSLYLMNILLVGGYFINTIIKGKNNVGSSVGYLFPLHFFIYQKLVSGQLKI